MPADAGEGDADVVAVSVDFEKVPAPSADEPFVVEEVRHRRHRG